MSLNVSTIHVGDQEFTLRLTSKAVMNYAKKHGTDGGSPVIAVLEAVNNLEAKGDLLTNALNHPENKNKIKDGYLLLDLMADDPIWQEPEAKNKLILDLAHESGLLGDDDYDSLLVPVAESNRNLISTMAKLLTGQPISTNAAGEAAETAEGNPT